MRKEFLLVVAGLTLAACGVQQPPATANSDEASFTALATLSWPAYRNGDSGRDIVTLQYLLRHRGYSLSVDGVFGSGTESAVRSFQSSRGLTVDGVVGSNTWEALIVTTREGDSNNAVRAVQDQLRHQYGYGITVDGVFGSGTAGAVRDFQSKRGLSADGIVGLYTWHALVTGTTGGGTTASKLASQILNNTRITLGTSSSTSGGSPRQNIVDTANGLPAKRGCSYDANCGLTVYLKANMLQGMQNVASRYTLYITSIAGGIHSSTSYHYRGTGMDIGIVNGVVIRGDSSLNRAVMQACRDFGAIEVLGPSNDANHQTHIHCAWPD